MGCDEIRDLLALMAGGEVYENERVAVEAHVALCAACARELDQYREMRASLSALKEGEAPASTWKSLWEGIRSGLFPSRPSRALVLADQALRYAAVLLVGMAIGVALYFFQRTSEPGPLAAPSDPARVEPAVVSGGDPFGRPVLSAPAAGFPLAPAPRPQPPRARTDSNGYLPRVEAIPASLERDF
jgi:anti-sigma factor RsiW